MAGDTTDHDNPWAGQCLLALLRKLLVKPTSHYRQVNNQQRLLRISGDSGGWAVASKNYRLPTEMWRKIMNVKKVISVLVLLYCSVTVAQEPVEVGGSDLGYPLKVILDAVSKNINKPIYADARVHPKTPVQIYGKGVYELDYGDLLRILRLHGYTAYETGTAINVIVVQGVRADAVPTAKSGDEFYPDQFVNRVIALDKICAVRVLPSLRPLVSQRAHMTAVVDSNALVIVDYFANIQRLETMIAELENSTDRKEDCALRSE